MLQRTDTRFPYTSLCLSAYGMSFVTRAWRGMAVAGTGGRQLSHGVRDRRRSCKSQTPRPGPGRKGASARRSALFAHPHLLPADGGDAAGHAELLAAFDDRKSVE